MEPTNFAIAMSCIQDIIEILLKSEEKLPLGGTAAASVT
jgi:hypothetical protein